MRYSLLGLALISGLALAGTTETSEERFEKRFHAADKNKDGKLSRSEAYAEFPRAPEYFDEIDRNKDGQVTLAEVKAAMQKRVDAAMAGGGTDGRYKLPDSPAGGAPDAGAGSAFASKEEAARAHRYDYYESLAASQEADRMRGQPTMPTLMKKTF